MTDNDTVMTTATSAEPTSNINARLSPEDNLNFTGAAATETAVGASPSASQPSLSPLAASQPVDEGDNSLAQQLNMRIKSKVIGRRINLARSF